MSANTEEHKPRGGKPQAPRRGRGFRQVATHTRAGLATAASRHGFAESDVLIHWPDIVGEGLAGLCHPLSVSYGKARGFGATLVVRVEGARAPEAEMKAPQIVERVNAYYGYRAISRLRVTQITGRRGRAKGFAEDRAAFRHAPATPEPDAGTVREAGALTDGIRDPALRDALTRMGAYVLSRARGAEPRRKED